MAEKTDAQLQQELRERARVLAQRRLPKLQAALAAIDGEGADALRAELTAARDALETDDPAWRAADQLLQMMGATRGVLRHHLGAAEDAAAER